MIRTPFHIRSLCAEHVRCEFLTHAYSRGTLCPAFTADWLSYRADRTYTMFLLTFAR